MSHFPGFTFSTLNVPTVYLPMDTLDGNAVTGGTYDLTSHVGSMTTVAGIRGNGVYFNGESNANLGNNRDSCFWNPDLCPDGLTVSFWINVGDKTGTELYVFTNGGHTIRSFGMAFLLKNGEFMAIVRTTSRRHRAWGDFQVARNVWYHVVFTWNTAIGTSIYVDGVSRTRDSHIDSLTPNSNAFNNMIFGSENKNLDTPDRLWGEFTIDEFLFFDKWTSADFASQLYSGQSGINIQPFNENCTNVERRNWFLNVHSGLQI